MTVPTEQELSAFLHELADIAAAAVLPYFRAALTIEDKGAAGRFDPVTAADKAAERAIREAILRRFPDHAIIGEEFGAQPGAAPYRWVIDPIDGTKAFICGLPTWGTLIGVYRGDEPILGLMNQPVVGDRFIGGAGSATLHRGDRAQRLHTSGTSALSQANLFATSPDMFKPGVEAEAFARLSQQMRLTRYGVDCYAYCMLAAGFIDLVVEASLGFYDIAPLIPIVEAAGGVVSDWQGRPVRGGGRVIAAANTTLHGLALQFLQSCADGAPT